MNTPTAGPTRVLLVGDGVGIPQALRALPGDCAIGIVAASNRPQYHAELRRAAETHSLPFLVQPARRSSDYPGFLRAVAALRPALILCNSYSMLLPDDLLAVAPMGGVNVHGGKVPEYRGPNPIQWAIINDEREAGVTMHAMTAEFDAGDVIAEAAVPILFGDRWRDVTVRIAAATERLLLETLPKVLAGTAPRRRQDDSRARTWPRRAPEDGRIDWDWSVLRIHNLIRALGDGIPPAFYEGRTGRVELDRYMPLAAVAALKFAPGPGGRPLVRGGAQLAPTDPDRLMFDVNSNGETVGTCGIDQIDVDARTGRPWTSPHDAGLLRLLREFSIVELGLTPVKSQ